MLRNFVQIVGVIAELPSQYLVAANIRSARSKLRINEQSAHEQLANIVAQEQALEDLLRCEIGDRVCVTGHLSVSKRNGKLQILAASIQPDVEIAKPVPCSPT